MSAQPNTPEMVYCSIGANLGEREQTLRACVDALDAVESSRVTRVSPLYETEPVGEVPQPDFLNAVVEVETALQPEAFFAACLRIEQHFGRERRIRWGPRTLDIDIILFGRRRVHTERLQIPHPRFSERAFVLIPLADLVPELIPPGYTQNIADLARFCPDQARIVRFDPEFREWFSPNP